MYSASYIVSSQHQWLPQSFFQPALPLARQWCAAGKRSQSLTNSFITFLTKCNLLIMLCLLQLTLLDAGVQRLRLAKTKMLKQKHIRKIVQHVEIGNSFSWSFFLPAAPDRVLGIRYFLTKLK